MIDRRYDKRVPLRIKVLVEGEGEKKTYYSLNISRGGIFLETEIPYNIDSELNMELVFDEEEHVFLKGKVVWVSYPHQSSSYVPGMGIKFIELNSEKVEKLGEILGGYLKRDIEVSENIKYSLDERIIVTSEDIYEQQAELMVSFAGIGIRDTIDHVKDVLNRCDDKIAAEYEKYVYALSFGQSFLMRVGEGMLNAKYVIHSVIPSFYDSYGQEALRMSTLNILKKSSEHGFKTVFYPAFALYEVGYPIEITAKILIGTCYGFMKKESFPVKVFFFCNNQDVMIFEKVKKEIFEG